MQTRRTDPDRFGIRARLLTLLLPGILGLLALDSWNDYRALHHLVQNAYDQAMLESVTALRSSLVVGADGSFKLNSPALLQAMFEATGPQRKHLHIGLRPHALDADAASPVPTLTLLGETDLPQPPAAPAMSAGALTQVPALWYDSYYRNIPVRVVALQSQVVDGRGQRFDLLIQAAESTVPRDEARAVTLQQQLWRDVRMVVVVIFLVWLGVTWSLQPLERLRKSVLDSRGQALKPLDTRGVPNEVAPLVEAVNQHVASYRDLLDQQSQFLADASHQLRTPLAIMLTQAGVALREKDPAQLRETLRAIVTQISRSRRLCEQLLSLASASDNSPLESLPQMVDLGTIARDVVLQYLSLAHEKNQDLGWMDASLDEIHSVADTPASAHLLVVLATGPELHEALANLVHNAIVYTPAGGHITVKVSADHGQALVEVLDDGPGIAAARRDDVFKRFHQGSQSTEKSRHGAGLGLAIARAYARRNGGDIMLADLPAGPDGVGSGLGPDTVSHGLRAILSLPLAAR